MSLQHVLFRDLLWLQKSASSVARSPCKKRAKNKLSRFNAWTLSFRQVSLHRFGFYILFRQLSQARCSCRYFPTFLRGLKRSLANEDSNPTPTLYLVAEHQVSPLAEQQCGGFLRFVLGSS
ncbi:hypothetical protein ACU8KH_03890 [Lachancea thermotolerans]